MGRALIALVVGQLLMACASTPEPRPIHLDPSNAEAPRAPDLPIVEAFASGPRGLDEPVLPLEDPLQPDQAPARDHGDGHDGHEGHEGHEGHGPEVEDPAPDQDGHEADPIPDHTSPGGHGGHEDHGGHSP